LGAPAPTIFHLDDAATWRGGEQQVLYLHQGLLAQNYDSRVVCQKGGAFHARLQEAKLPHYAMRMVGGHDPGAAWRLRGLLRDRHSILHTHTAHAHDLGLWAGRFGARSRLVVSRRVDFPVASNPVSRWKYLSRRVDRYLAISSAVEQELVRAGIDASRIRRVPSGIDFSRFEDVEPDPGWRTRFGLEPGELLFCNVAALAPHKDQATLLRAFRHFLDAGGSGRLVILGEGELRTELERQTKQLGLDTHVFLPGFTHEVLPKLLASDVFVMSSRTEGLGTSILDAMALARPVVATRAGGIVDAVEHGETGLLVPPEDARAMAQALGDLQKSAATRQRMGLAGRRKVEEFDLRRTVELTLSAYLELFPATSASTG
jgi:glycosyltransferase involved in cell wall biosynthesis